jgi:hypothetical protein
MSGLAKPTLVISYDRSPARIDNHGGNFNIPQRKFTELILGDYGKLFDRYLVVEIDKGAIVGKKIQTKLGD